MRRILKRYWGTINRNNEESTEGKTIIVTGANTGMGKATVAEFLSRNTNSTIILACRNMTAASKAITDLQKEHMQSPAKLVAIHLDLGDLNSVRKFVIEFNSKYNKLNILINNAGVHPHHKGNKTTEQGHEIHFGVNHLGHFLLTNLLLDALKRGAPSRVVTLSATIIENTTLDFDDLNWQKRPIPNNWLNPCSIASKLAQALFSQELAKRVKDVGVNTYTACPGMVRTGTGEDLPIIIQWLASGAGYFFQSPAEGCLTTLYCALNKDLAQETGKFYRKCERYNLNLKNSPTIQDLERFWQESEKLVEMS